ncbi:hypothetical protein [Rubritalea tangerina]|uniref:hypothetical protein n=1 Tax=Rubritalea tangerina TaxID=430798 RepID=UPI003612C7F8
MGEQEADTLTQTVKEFDRLLADKNYRAIVEEPRKSKFVVVLGQLNDEPRIKQLNEIGSSILEIEKALKNQAASWTQDNHMQLGSHLRNSE